MKFRMPSKVSKTKKSKKPALDVADIVIDPNKLAAANQKSARPSTSTEEEIKGDITLDSPQVS